MFGNKIGALQSQITALTALIVSTGFQIDAEAQTLPTAEAFGAHLKGLSDTAIKAALGEQAAALTSAQGEASALRAGLAAAGITLPALNGAALPVADAAQVETIKGAVETAIAQRAARQVAGAGHPAAVETPLAESEAGVVAANVDVPPATAAEFKTKCDAIKDPAARTAYFRKHKARFIK